jgi:hypothetical protein
LVAWLPATGHFAAFLARYERNPAEVKRLASYLIELSTRQNFAYWLACGPFFVVGRAVPQVTLLKASRDCFLSSYSDDFDYELHFKF